MNVYNNYKRKIRTINVFIKTLQIKKRIFLANFFLLKNVLYVQCNNFQVTNYNFFYFKRLLKRAVIKVNCYAKNSFIKTPVGQKI